MPLPLVLAAAALPAAYQVGAGIVQGIRGKQMARNNKRPTYQIPQEILANQKLAAAAYADPRLAGQDLIEENLRTSTATGIDTAKNISSDSGDILDAITKLYTGESSNMKNLGISAAEQQQNDLNRLLGVNETVGAYQDKAFDYNKNQPYQDKAAASSALIEAGNKNIFGGLDTLGAVGQSSILPGGSLYPYMNKKKAPVATTASPYSPWVSSKLNTIQ